MDSQNAQGDEYLYSSTGGSGSNASSSGYDSTGHSQHGYDSQYSYDYGHDPQYGHASQDGYDSQDLYGYPYSYDSDYGYDSQFEHQSQYRNGSWYSDEPLYDDFELQLTLGANAEEADSGAQYSDYRTPFDLEELSSDSRTSLGNTGEPYGTQSEVFENRGGGADIVSTDTAPNLIDLQDDWVPVLLPELAPTEPNNGFSGGTQVQLSQHVVELPASSPEFFLPESNHLSDTQVEFRAVAGDNYHYRESYDRQTGILKRVLDVSAPNGTLHYEETFDRNSQAWKSYSELDTADGFKVRTAERPGVIRRREEVRPLAVLDKSSHRDGDFRHQAQSIARSLQPEVPQDLSPSVARQHDQSRLGRLDPPPERFHEERGIKHPRAVDEWKSPQPVAASTNPKAPLPVAQVELVLNRPKQHAAAQPSTSVASFDTPATAKLDEFASDDFFQPPRFPSRPILRQDTNDPKQRQPKPKILPRAVPKEDQDSLRSLAAGGYGLAKASPRGHTLQVPDSYDSVKMKAYRKGVLVRKIGRNAGPGNRTDVRRRSHSQRLARAEHRASRGMPRSTAPGGRGWALDHIIELHHDLTGRWGEKATHYRWQDSRLNSIEGSQSWALNRMNPQGVAAGGVARTAEAGRWYNTPHFRGVARFGGRALAGYGLYQSARRIKDAIETDIAESTMGVHTGTVVASESAGWAGALYLGKVAAPLGVYCGPGAWACVPAFGLIGGGLGYFLGVSAMEGAIGLGRRLAD